MKKFVVKMMIAAYKSAKEYHDEALLCENAEHKEMFKQLALGEVEEFEKLSHLYKGKEHLEVKDHDYWLEYFYSEITEIKHAIHELT